MDFSEDTSNADFSNMPDKWEPKTGTIVHHLWIPTDTVRAGWFWTSVTIFGYQQLPTLILAGGSSSAGQAWEP